eukprot:2480859-Pleurochrysis_carterae.AAC.1
MALGAGGREVACSDGFGINNLTFFAAVIVAVFIHNCFASRLGRRRHVFVGVVSVSTIDNSTRRTALSILEPE